MVSVVLKQIAEDDLDLARCGKAKATAEIKQHAKLLADEASHMSYNRYKHDEIFREILSLT